MPRKREKLNVGGIDIDAPLRLADAVEIAFPNGALSVSGLRREIAKGRLVVEVIAGKTFVTLNAIKEMRRLCRVQAKVPAFISSPNAAPETEVSGSDPAGSSAMDLQSSAQDALRRKLKKLKVG